MICHPNEFSFIFMLPSSLFKRTSFSAPQPKFGQIRLFVISFRLPEVSRGTYDIFSFRVGENEDVLEFRTQHEWESRKSQRPLSVILLSRVPWLGDESSVGAFIHDLMCVCAAAKDLTETWEKNPPNRTTMAKAFMYVQTCTRNTEKGSWRGSFLLGYNCIGPKRCYLECLGEDDAQNVASPDLGITVLRNHSWVKVGQPHHLKFTKEKCTNDRTTKFRKCPTVCILFHTIIQCLHIVKTLKCFSFTNCT